MILTCKVETDSITERVSQAFDYKFEGVTQTEITVPTFPKEYQLGVIVGASGSGKSTLLKQLGTEEVFDWNENKSIASHFTSPEEALDKLGASGLNSIPSWLKPYHVLSTGEKFRVDLARRLKDYAVIDEFTSVVDRNVAKSASVSISKYIRNKGLKNITLSTCHYDILDWLEPDWVYDTTSRKFYDRGCLRRPKVELEILPCSVKAWDLFKKHHYLTHEINPASDCYMAVWENTLVAFYSILAFPSGAFKNGWRGHRLVVLPDYQGMGIGTRFSEAIAQFYVNSGKRFFAKTANPRTGEHRNKSHLWKATSTNGKDRKCDLNSLNWESKKNKKGFDVKSAYLSEMALRVCYSHEFIGGEPTTFVYGNTSNYIKDSIFDFI